MRRLVCAVLVALAVPLSLAAPADAGQTIDRVLSPPCRAAPVCVIRMNHGGDLEFFQRAAQEVLREGKLLVIDGRCESACVVLADIARTNTCLTTRAEMAVHKTSVMRVVGRRMVRGRRVPVVEILGHNDPPQSADIHQWVHSQGGYPADSMMVMSLQVARQFWPMCDRPQS